MLARGLDGEAARLSRGHLRGLRRGLQGFHLHLRGARLAHGAAPPRHHRGTRRPAPAAHRRAARRARHALPRVQGCDPGRRGHRPHPGLLSAPVPAAVPLAPQRERAATQHLLLLALRLRRGPGLRVVRRGDLRLRGRRGRQRGRARPQERPAPGLRAASLRHACPARGRPAGAGAARGQSGENPRPPREGGGRGGPALHGRGADAVDAAPLHEERRDGAGAQPAPGQQAQ
mmetsp:Transcript_69186/g.213963  ORF Transcript_69186/g.213963 Transcript_69186/m.213963 type:complete len:231 (-) Transcript_69186:359-1051(-)